MFLTSLVFSISMLSGLGFYAKMGVEASAETQNEDVQAAAENLDGIEFDEDRSSSILQGPLAALVPAMEILMSLVTILSNTSGVVQLLFGASAIVGDTIELFFRLTMLITLAFVIRGLIW